MFLINFFSNSLHLLQLIMQWKMHCSARPYDHFPPTTVWPWWAELQEQAPKNHNVSGSLQTLLPHCSYRSLKVWAQSVKLFLPIAFRLDRKAQKLLEFSAAQSLFLASIHLSWCSPSLACALKCQNKIPISYMTLDLLFKAPGTPMTL